MAVNNEALLKISEKVRRYCAYQERCISEVREKLSTWELGKVREDKILDELADEGYLDEERYARIFASGKFRIKQWGRIKIKYALKEKWVPEALIEAALKEINAEEYSLVLDKQLEQKMEELAPMVKNKYQLNERVARYLLARGFEPDLVWQRLKKEK